MPKVRAFSSEKRNLTDSERERTDPLAGPVVRTTQVGSVQPGHFATGSVRTAALCTEGGTVLRLSGHTIGDGERLGLWHLIGRRSPSIRWTPRCTF